MKKRVTGRDAQNPSEQVTTTWGRRGEGRGVGGYRSGECKCMGWGVS